MKQLTKYERKLLQRQQRAAKAFQERLEKEIQEVFNMETSRTARNAWKVASYMANKERQ